jgi:hypothetical protein
MVKPNIYLEMIRLVNQGKYFDTQPPNQGQIKLGLNIWGSIWPESGLNNKHFCSPQIQNKLFAVACLTCFSGGSIEDLFEMAGTVAATLAEAGASPQEIATAMKAALSGNI